MEEIETASWEMTYQLPQLVASDMLLALRLRIFGTTAGNIVKKKPDRDLISLLEWRNWKPRENFKTISARLHCLVRRSLGIQDLVMAIWMISLSRRSSLPNINYLCELSTEKHLLRDRQFEIHIW